jgi:circadian clock protein KaiB
MARGIPSGNQAPSDISASTLQRASAKPLDAHFVLTLFVSGMSPRSRCAIHDTRKFCAHFLAGPYVLHIIDIYQQPRLAHDAHIIATPALVKSAPPPLRRVVGKLHNPDHLLLRLGIVPPPLIQ